MRTIRALALCLVAGLLLPRLLLADTITTTNPYVGVTKIDETLSSPRPEAVHILEIDLTAPGIHFEMSPATPPNPPQSGDVTTVQKTLTYMNSVNAQFAINTEFFVNPPHANSATPLWGFAASNGNVYSPFQATNGNTYAIAPNAAAINIDPTNQASVVTRNTSDSSGMTVAQPVTIGNAVSGSAQIITNGQDSIPTYAEAGGVLTDGSGYSSSNSWYANNHLAARSAMGLSQDNKTLFLLTVDNNANDNSQGLTVTELADFMRTSLGVWNALNLDGGGSTTLSWVNPSTSLSSDINLTSNIGGNTYSDGRNDRAVGASLAVFATPTPEPGTLAMLLTGAGLFIASTLRRKIRPLFQSLHNRPNGQGTIS